MDNHKSELLESMEILSHYVGTLAGKVVICSKEVGDYVKNMIVANPGTEPESSTQRTESVKSRSKKKFAEMEKKKPAAKQNKLKEK